MTYGIGGMGYGNQMGMMGMPGMTQQNSQTTGNVHQYFKSKYGCETCLRQGPVPRILPVETLTMTREEYQPSFFKRLYHRIFG